MTSERATEDNLIRFDSREQAARLALELIQNARREICFFGPQIDPVLLDNSEVIEAISAFLRHSRRTQVRIVMVDTQKNVVNSHQILPLAQRLTSSISIHVADRKHQDLRQQFLLVDGIAYLFCPNAERYRGRMEKQAPAVVKDMQQEFEEIWNLSKPDRNTRRLHL